MVSYSILLSLISNPFRNINMCTGKIADNDSRHPLLARVLKLALRRSLPSYQLQPLSRHWQLCTSSPFWFYERDTYEFTDLAHAWNHFAKSKSVYILDCSWSLIVSSEIAIASE